MDPMKGLQYQTDTCEVKGQKRMQFVMVYMCLLLANCKTVCRML